MQTAPLIDTSLEPISFTLTGETACYLVLALKEKLGEGTLNKTAARVYEEVVRAIIAGMESQSQEAQARR